ncbi:MAG: hypothetical protein HPY50_04660 [Firmicutes bacterium]|nr:hypothetical protein [Bacillota bacterium]
MRFRNWFALILLVSLVCLTAACVNQGDRTKPAPPVDQKANSFVLQEQKASTEVSKGQKEGSGTQKPIESELVGMWHASPMVAAGYNQVFLFYSDGVFKHYYKNEESRVRDISGKWLIKNNNLILQVSHKTVIEGGERGEPSPSSTARYSIVHGKTVRKKIDPPEGVILSIGKIERDDKYFHPVMLKIGSQQYWKYDDDPVAADSMKLFDLMGVWSASPYQGAGWDDTFVFLGDLSFKHHFTQYDGENSFCEISGQWSILTGNKIELRVKDQTIIETGKPGGATPSVASQQEAVNGKIAKQKVDPPVDQAFSVSRIEYDDSSPNPMTVKIGGKQYWKYFEDPNDPRFKMPEIGN